LRQADPAEFGQRHYSIALLGQAQLAELIDIRGPQVPGIGDPLGNESHRVFFVPAQGDNHGAFHLNHSRMTSGTATPQISQRSRRPTLVDGIR
jgi:hypothetical protein